VKILLVSDYGTLAGGAELQLQMLREGLRRRGHDARLLATTAQPGGGRSIADYECLGTTSSFRTMLQSFNPWAFVALRRILREFRPDVVHVTLFLTQLSPTILPLLRGTPSVFYAVWHRAVCPRGTKLRPDGTPCDIAWGNGCFRTGCLPRRDWAPLMFQRVLWRRWRGAFDRVVANSVATEQQLREGGFEVAEVIRPGVPVLPLGRPLAPVPTVAFAGRLVFEKGVDVLLAAFSEVVRRLPSARLVLVGDGPERSAIGQQVRSQGLAQQVEMTGQLSAEDTQRRLVGAWVQAVPSRWPEPFGMVAAEAMMRGTAVVASATGGLPEVVQHERTGLLVPPGDEGSLTAALLRLLQDPLESDRMGREGREIAVATFGVEAQVDRFLGTYRATCGAGAG
jgi:glycosyltransferase involved in cell wall biosynthesis